MVALLGYQMVEKKVGLLAVKLGLWECLLARKLAAMMAVLSVVELVDE